MMPSSLRPCRKPIRLSASSSAWCKAGHLLSNPVTRKSPQPSNPRASHLTPKGDCFMRDLMPGNLPWRSLLVIGVVALVAVPSWSLSQPPVIRGDVAVQLAGDDKQPTAKFVHGDVVVQLAGDDKQPAGKEGDRLDRLEKQLEALLKEMETLRGQQPTDAQPGEKSRTVIHARHRNHLKASIPREHDPS